MIQNYDQIRSQLKIINEYCLESYICKIQKIYSTTRFVCLTVRFKGKTVCLYLGRGKGYEGIWIHNQIPTPSLRAQDVFLQYLRKYLINGSLIGIEMDESDRIIKIVAMRERKKIDFYFFWSGRKLYFLNSLPDDHNEQSFFCSWNGAVKSSDGGYSLFDEVGRKTLNSKKNLNPKAITPIETLLEKEDLETFQKDQTPKISSAERKKEKIKNEIENLQQWENINQLVYHESFSLEEKDSFSLGNIKVKFPRDWNHFKKLDKIFNKWKGIKKAIKIQQERLLKLETEIKSISNKEVLSIDKKNHLIIRPIFKLGKSGDGDDSNNKKQLVNKENKDLNSCDIYSGILKDKKYSFAIGKNSHANDSLRNSWASKEDYWFHLEGYQSAHLILKIDRNSQLDIDLLTLIGSALRDYSAIKLSSIPVLYTQVKNLKGVKGSPGKVIYKKQKEISVFYNENWKSSLQLKD